MREVFLPETMEELWPILDSDPNVALYAGGTDLLVALRHGVIRPTRLVCLERLESLKGVQDHGNEVFIGAATTHARLLENQSVHEKFPVLAKAVGSLASPPIRNMGTIGGNIVTASPAGDTLPALYALRAEIEIRSAKASLRVPIEKFVLGPGQVSLIPGEIVSGIWLDGSYQWTISHYEKVGRRKAQACSVASLAALVSLSDDGLVEDVRLAWGSVGPTVVVSEEAEAALMGKPLTVETLNRAAEIAQKVVSPIDDIRASAEYRRIVAGRLLLRLSDYAG
jgi:CO/xanthine dehydrogenase FAD-binding subunit